MPDIHARRHSMQQRPSSLSHWAYVAYQISLSPFDGSISMRCFCGLHCISRERRNGSTSTRHKHLNTFLFFIRNKNAKIENRKKHETPSETMWDEEKETIFSLFLLFTKESKLYAFVIENDWLISMLRQTAITREEKQRQSIYVWAKWMGCPLPVARI